MSSQADPSPDPALRLLEAHCAFGRAFSNWAHSLLKGAAGSQARLRLLGVLHCKGPQIMCGLGDELGVTARQVTNLVDKLERKGLVRRVEHPTDRRATMIEITPPGAELAGKRWRAYQEQVAGLFRELPKADQRELLRLVETLHNALRRRTQGGPGR